MELDINLTPIRGVATGYNPVGISSIQRCNRSVCRALFEPLGMQDLHTLPGRFLAVCGGLFCYRNTNNSEGKVVAYDVGTDRSVDRAN